MEKQAKRYPYRRTTNFTASLPPPSSARKYTPAKRFGCGYAGIGLTLGQFDALGFTAKQVEYQQSAVAAAFGEGDGGEVGRRIGKYAYRSLSLCWLFCAHYAPRYIAVALAIETVHREVWQVEVEVGRASNCFCLKLMDGGALK